MNRFGFMAGIAYFFGQVGYGIARLFFSLVAAVFLFSFGIGLILLGYYLAAS